MRTFPAFPHYFHVDKPYDRMMKRLSAEAAFWLVYVARVLPLETARQMIRLDSEVAGPALHVDQIFRLPRPGPLLIVHFEFQADWTTEVPRRVGEYQMVIRLENGRCEVRTVVFVLRPPCPAAGEAVYEEEIYSPGLRVKYHIVRLWEQDPTETLACGDPRLLPLAAVMKLAEGQLEELADRVAAANDPEIEAMFVALAAVHYDKGRLEELLNRGRKMYTKEVLKSSWAVQEVIEESRAEGEAAEARRIAKRMLAKKFGLDLANELDSILRTDDIEEVIMVASQTNSREPVVEAIQRIVRRTAS